MLSIKKVESFFKLFQLLRVYLRAALVNNGSDVTCVSTGLDLLDGLRRGSEGPLLLDEMCHFFLMLQIFEFDL